jgi:Probable cobalt transporter subunit (CbtB)
MPSVFEQGRTIPEGGFALMATIPAPGSQSRPRVQVSPEALSGTRIALILGITVLLALAIYYFVGIDEGMSSVFGKTMVIHEWVHDSRHFLGFPCH